jgi:hypothetical protein
MFVSVQADETTEISNKTQLVIVLRFAQGFNIVGENIHTIQKNAEVLLDAS